MRKHIGQVKSNYIHIRVSPTEKAEITAAAKKEGLESITAYLLWLHRQRKK